MGRNTVLIVIALVLAVAAGAILVKAPPQMPGAKKARPQGPEMGGPGYPEFIPHVTPDQISQAEVAEARASIPQIAAMGA